MPAHWPIVLAPLLDSTIGSVELIGRLCSKLGYKLPSVKLPAAFGNLPG
jgi:hypothetical protein